MMAVDKVLASPHCSSPFPHGEARFVEDRTAPSRAYLKLWELFTLIAQRPQPGELCVDMGSSPGGWVLQGLGARVISVDKAPLDPTLAKLPGIAYQRQSAFALDPRTMGPVDWLFSDVICYPKRLLSLMVERRRLADARQQRPSRRDLRHVSRGRINVPYLLRRRET
jgi:23S rRNA (cytidine2498-2'-O)-methyltransferase